jgi:hypothetical protein
MGWPGEALAWTGQPLAYVKTSGGISVIDTGDNKVVDTIASSLSSLAVAPDGKRPGWIVQAAREQILYLSTVKAHFDRDHPTFDDLPDHWR